MARTKSKTELFGKHPLAKSIEPVIEKWSQENYPAINGKQITHVAKKDSLSDDDFDTLRDKVFSSDDASNPVRVIVSVLMLREGFEVRKKLMKFIQNAKSNEIIEADWTKLSNFKTMKVRMERAIATKKCVYPYVNFPSRGGFERKFTGDILENDSSVEAYVKLNQYTHKFSIP
jgi:hypothetical protein